MFSRKKNWNTLKSEQKKDMPRRYWVYLFLLILCIIGTVYVLRLPDYQIRSVQVQNAVVTRESDIHRIAHEYLTYKYFYLVPQSNVWLYPRSKIKKDIESLPSIADVTLDLRGKVLYIEISEKDNKFIFCKSESECFYMNEEGYIFAPAPLIEGNVFLKFKGVMGGEVLGQYFLSHKTIADILAFEKKLGEKGLNVASVDVVSEREVVFELMSRARLIVSLEDNFDEIYRNLDTIISSEDFMNRSGGFGNIEYLDLRYGKKAFWRSKMNE